MGVGFEVCFIPGTYCVRFHDLSVMLFIFHYLINFDNIQCFKISYFSTSLSEVY